ncbi:MAG TPA: hypothetical protein DCZ94_06025 [Lentisphaeria bacterium]|nr:MAG: hypothetical protein A2X48_00395 [Lentisphaerae bacterium GWF2_49_21]HBC86494.1 hypothetical protein [Lentisphaeria bacterium]
MKSFLLFSTVLFFLCGCSSLKSFEKGQLLSMLAGTGTGYIGYKVAEDQKKDSWIYKNKEIVAGLSGVGGYAVSELIRANVDESFREEFRTGYELGANDTAREQYWIIQSRQKEDESCKQQNVRTRYYEFPGTALKDNINYVPHDVIMRTEEFP